ncbi:carbohydrate ABC transporter permease [Treponema parvum]|uniref:Carbohydrate ABC transporter permease n=1 Tax=Treponema parvum TaxID=138851 RepID=A0A975EY70_9SPIR|nr:carbohydrate ABC transporter permease [Treponema parvum]QTQ10957.1 carbohydrate ABC transporter permease [Treponema parvum]QTQ14891.1 carbohydrate ABC transporter permease [Treponema parvum]
MISYNTKKTIGKFVKYVFLLFITVISLLPIVIVLSSSFKNESEIFDFPFHLIPRKLIFSNFAQLSENFPLYIWNSIKLTSIITILQLFSASTGGYVFSKMQWKGRNFIFGLYLASMMIPSQAVTIPQFVIMRTLNLYDTHLAIILLCTFTAFGTFLIRQYFLSIPDTYIEAARIDGAREWIIFFKIMLPMAKPVLVTQAILSFRFFWNDFFTPLIYITTPELKTLPLGMTDFVREQYVYWGPQMAAALISIIPVLIIFMFGQRYFIEGVSSSGIKG